MDTNALLDDISLTADCGITNPALLSNGIRFSLYSLSIAVALMRHRFPNIRSFNIMNVSLAVAGLLLLGGGLWQTFHHSLRLSDAVSLILLLAVVRPSWRGAWGRNFWASDLRFSQTGDRSPGLFNSGIFCGLAPWLNYILIDNVYGHPDVFGPHPTCNDRVRLSLLGAGVPVALPVTPYAVSLLILAIVLAMLATEARHFGLADEVRLANVLQDLNVRQMLLRDEDPWDSRTRVLDSYNKSLQNNWVDVTHYRCTVSVLGRLYLIATLEHTLFLNRNEKGGVLGPGLKLLQPVTILSIACILLQGLACSWFMQEKDDDDDDDTHLDLFQWLLSTANQPGTVLGSLANSISFDRQILSTYFNMRGASSTRGIHPGLNQMLVRSRQELRRQTRRLAREAKNVMPLPNELAIWISSIVMDMALSVLAALAAALVLIVSRGSPLPSHQLIQLAALSGAVKAGLANATSLLCKASASNFASIVLFLISSPVVSLAVVAVLAQKILGDVPVSLVNASLIASLPLILSQSMMLPTFYITDDRTFLLLLFDALGGYTLTKVAHGSGLAISVSPWQGVFVLFIFGFVTSIIKLIVLLAIAFVESWIVMGNCEPRRPDLRTPLIASSRFSPYGAGLG